MDITFIQKTISGLKVVTDIATGLLNAKELPTIKAKIPELHQALLVANRHALDAQEAQAEMAEIIRDLKEEVVRIKAWNHEKERYMLTSILENTAVVYAIKKAMSNSEPPHWICTKCYEDGKRMILQTRHDKKGFVVIACPSCPLEIHTYLRGIPSPEYV